MYVCDSKMCLLGVNFNQWYLKKKKSRVVPKIVSNDNSNQAGEHFNKSTFDGSIKMAKAIETYNSTSKINFKND